MEAARVESLGVRERLAIAPFWVLLGAHLIWLGVHSPSKKPFKPGLMASIVLTWVAIVGVFVEIPIVSDYAFWVLAAAYFLIVSVTGHQKKWSEGRFWAGHQSRFRLITREDIPSSERSIRILVMSKPGDGDKMVDWEYGAFKSEPGADYAVDDTLTPPREYIRIHCAGIRIWQLLKTSKLNLVRATCPEENPGRRFNAKACTFGFGIGGDRHVS